MNVNIILLPGLFYKICVIFRFCPSVYIAILSLGFITFPHSHYEHPSLALHTILASILADVVHCPTSSMSGPRPDQARYCREHLGRQGWRVHQVKQASSEKASQSEVGTRSFKAQNCKLNRMLTDGAKQHSVWAAAFSGCVWPWVFSVHERHNKRTNISITLCICLESMI